MVYTRGGVAMTLEMQLRQLLLVLLLFFGTFCIGALAAATPVFQGIQKVHSKGSMAETTAARGYDGATPLPPRAESLSAGSNPGAHAVQVPESLRRMELSAEEQENLLKLRSLMMEADATETEVITTSRFL